MCYGEVGVRCVKVSQSSGEGNSDLFMSAKQYVKSPNTRSYITPMCKGPTRGGGGGGGQVAAAMAVIKGWPIELNNISCGY